jgi:phosphatidylethanolamine/phosphatidyl-N-methylethanolamine N-methyltransferase
MRFGAASRAATPQRTPGRARVSPDGSGGAIFLVEAYKLLRQRQGLCNKGGVLTTANALVQQAYNRLADVYDFVFGAILQPGRERAVRSIVSRPGLRVLELGIGTGLTAPLYSRDWSVVGVDLSPAMLQHARKRIAELKLDNSVRLVLADGAKLPFDDESFDVVLVPYVMSVVPDPIGVGVELRRVCRQSGQIILLNHFLSQDSVGARLERWISPLTAKIGFRTDLSLQWLLSGAGLRPTHVSAVNVPRIWKLVTCIKE